MASERRPTVSRRTLPGKPAYLPPPPPDSVSEAPPETLSAPKPANDTQERVRSYTTRVIIKEGKKVRPDENFDFGCLENSQSIALLDAVKVCV